MDEEPVYPIHNRPRSIASMRYYMILSVGFFAQLLFASRMIVQWVQSERAGKVISPTLFWQTSLLASFLLLIYGVLRHDAIIMGGQFLSYFIYIRNLQLKNEWRTLPLLLRLLTFSIPPLVLFALFGLNEGWVTNLFAKNSFAQPWMLIGLIGQLCLNLRFVYQWYLSEKIHKSFFPVGFWVISLAGSVLVILYGFYRKDPVLIFAQGLGFFIYFRNIILGKNQSVV